MMSERRKFLQNIVFLSGALGLDACKSTRAWPQESDHFLKVSPMDPDIPKRQPWTALSPEDKIAFIGAVKKMKGMTVNVPGRFGWSTDRTLDQWTAQSQTHQFYCTHHNWLFLPWHRAYLHFFELQLRKQIRDSFRLPYWDWTQSQEIPIELQDSGLLQTLQITRSSQTIAFASSDSNIQSREWWQNARGEIDSCLDFDTIAGDKNSSGVLESPYHNMVHVGIGGDMGIIPFAAKDPIFWLHHCNVDRLWSLWMDRLINSGHLRQMFPSKDVGEWLNTRFDEHFWGPDGQLASITVRGALFTDLLEYNYATMQQTWDFRDVPTDQPVAEQKLVVTEVQPRSSAGLLLNTASASSLNLAFVIPHSILAIDGHVISLRLKCKGIPRPLDPGVSYRCRLHMGERVFPLLHLVFFSGASKHHGENAIGINLSKYKEEIRGLARSGVATMLELVPVNKSNQILNLQKATGVSSSSALQFDIEFKAVFA